MCYFSDMTDLRAKQSLDKIIQSFEDLEDLENTLVYLHESCEKSSTIVS